MRLVVANENVDPTISDNIPQIKNDTTNIATKSLTTHYTLLHDTNGYYLFTSLLNLSQQFLVGVQQVLFVTDLEGRPTVRRQQHLVTSLHRSGDGFTSSGVDDTGTSGDHGTFGQLFLVLFGNVQAQSGLGGRLESLHKDSVKEGLERGSVLQKRHIGD